MTKKEWKSKAKFLEKENLNLKCQFIEEVVELERKLDIANGTVAKLMKENDTLNKIAVKLDKIRHKSLMHAAEMEEDMRSIIEIADEKK